MENVIERYEQISVPAELKAPIERFLAEVVILKRDAIKFDDMEDMLREAEQKLMPELLKAVIEERGREVEAKTEMAANTTKHRKKNCA